MARKAKGSERTQKPKRKAEELDEQQPEKAEEGAEAIDDSWEAPSEKDWEEKYRRYKSFKLPGSDENYKAGEFVYIFPGQTHTPPKKKGRKAAGPDEEHDEANDPDADPSWIAQIAEVRALGERNVFMRARWLFTTISQLREIRARGIPRRLEGHEVLYSDATDLLPVHVVDDRASIHAFDETSAVQDPIPIDAVFYRSQVITEGTSASPKSTGKKNTKQPKIQPFHAPTCFCKKPYTPLPLDTQPMVYCPSIRCRKWFHCQCLGLRNLQVDPSPSQLDELRGSGLNLVADLPEVELDAGKGEEGEGEEITEIPSEVVASAEQSIVRGTKHTGIVGNGQRVIIARDIVAAKNKGKNLALPLKIWREKMKDKVWAGDAMAPTKEDTSCWVCPDCKSVI